MFVMRGIQVVECIVYLSLLCTYDASLVYMIIITSREHIILEESTKVFQDFAERSKTMIQ